MSTTAREEMEKAFLPAMGIHWLLPLYDPLTTLLGVDRARVALIRHAALQPGNTVLDIGCGTGSLAIGIQRLHRGVAVIGLDPDAKALARARRKAERAGVSIRFENGFADAIPHPDGFFDAVFSSFMFHHLDRSQKQGMLREVHRVLKPGGRFLMADFGGTSSALHRLRDSAEERVLAAMKEAELMDARVAGTRSLLAGLLLVVHYEAVCP